ncbi:UNVERIFIED_CONTAM: hypothetical protein FKN15_018126 [Acipenser sinensis]
MQEPTVQTAAPENSSVSATVTERDGMFMGIIKKRKMEKKNSAGALGSREELSCVNAPFRFPKPAAEGLSPFVRRGRALSPWTVAVRQIHPVLPPRGQQTTVSAGWLQYGGSVCGRPYDPKRNGEHRRVDQEDQQREHRRLDREDQQQYSCSKGTDYVNGERAERVGMGSAGKKGAGANRIGAAAPKVGAGRRGAAVGSPGERSPGIACTGGAATGGRDRPGARGGEHHTSTTAPAHNPGRGSGAGQCGPLPLAPGTLPVFLDLPALGLEPRSLHHQPQLCPWFPTPLSPSTQTSLSCCQTSLVLPLFTAKLPWVIGHRCIGPQVKTSARCCIPLFPGCHFGRPCHPGGVPSRRFKVPSWKRRRNRPTLKPACVHQKKKKKRYPQA